MLLTAMAVTGGLEAAPADGAASHSQEAPSGTVTQADLLFFSPGDSPLQLPVILGLAAAAVFVVVLLLWRRRAAAGAGEGGGTGSPGQAGYTGGEGGMAGAGADDGWPSPTGSGPDSQLAGAGGGGDKGPGSTSGMEVLGASFLEDGSDAAGPGGMEALDGKFLESRDLAAATNAGIDAAEGDGKDTRRAMEGDTEKGTGAPVEGEMGERAPEDEAESLLAKLAEGIDDGGQEESADGRINPLLRSVRDSLSKALKVSIIPKAKSLHVYLSKKSGPSAKEQAYIENIFLISPKNILMDHYTSQKDSDMDPDIVSGMLMVVQTFVGDSFQSEEGSLNELKYGEMTVIISKGSLVTMAAVVKGPGATGFRNQVDAAIGDIESGHSELIETWDGSMDKLEPLEPYMRKLVLGEYRGHVIVPGPANGQMPPSY